jgi:DNA-directed RNA polymerase subunit RPC12/RpoP
LSSKLVVCPSCGYRATVRARQGKTELRCPKCGKEFNVWF